MLGDQLTSSLEAATPTPLTPPSSTDSANRPEDAQAQKFRDVVQDHMSNFGLMQNVGRHF